MKNITISPSILSADFANLEKEIKALENVGIKWVHIDVMDGHFVPNISIGIPAVKSIRNITDLVLDTHLMIENPEKYIKDFANAGSDVLTFHYEACKNAEHVFEIISLIKTCNKKVGLSIKPHTNVNEIVQFLNDIDLLLIMTVEPGFGGQEFIYECAKKIPQIKENLKKDIIIQVDGGINNITSKICTSLGATNLVAGSYIFKQNDYKNAIDSLY